MALLCINFSLKDFSQFGEMPRLKTVFALHVQGMSWIPITETESRKLASMCICIPSTRTRRWRHVCRITKAFCSPAWSKTKKQTKKTKQWRIVLVTDPVLMGSDREQQRKKCLISSSVLCTDIHVDMHLHICICTCLYHTHLCTYTLTLILLVLLFLQHRYIFPHMKKKTLWNLTYSWKNEWTGWCLPDMKLVYHTCTCFTQSYDRQIK